MEDRLRARLVALGRTPGVEPLVAALLRARIVRESARFTARELMPPLGGGRPHRYRLRADGLAVHVQHGTPDSHTLAEIWHAMVYEPPAEAAAAMAELPARPRLLDLGANVGMFAAWFAGRHPGARLVAYEPDPRNAELLRRTLAANAAGFSEWELRAGAAGASDRDAAMVVGEYTTSRMSGEARGGAAVVVRCWDVLPELRECDFLKIDVEGGEWEILRDERFAECAAAVVVIEPHAGDDAPADPVAGARELLERAGYTSAVTHGVKPEGAPSVWGWRARSA